MVLCFLHRLYGLKKKEDKVGLKDARKRENFSKTSTPETSHLHPSLRYGLLKSHCWLDAVQRQCDAVSSSWSRSVPVQRDNFLKPYKYSSQQTYDCIVICVFTRLLICSWCGSERPATREGERTAPAAASYEDYWPPTFAKIKVQWLKYICKIWVVFFFFKWLWPPTSCESAADTECRMNLTTTGRSSSCTADNVAMTAARTCDTRLSTFSLILLMTPCCKAVFLLPQPAVMHSGSD